MNWDHLRVFIAVAEGGSIAAASRTLRVSIATLARRLDRLEMDLGLALTLRGPNGIQLTEEGRRILEVARAGGEHLFRVENVAAALRSGETSEPIRVSATEPVVAEILAPNLRRLRASHPEIRVDLVVSTELVSLHRREAELAVRLARPRVETLVARRLPDVAMGFYASRRFLAGRRADAIELGGEPLLAFDDAYGEIPETRWIRQQRLEGQIVFTTSSTRALLNAARAGVGIATLPRFLAERESVLVEVEAFRIPSRQLWLVFHKDTRRVAQIVAVRQWILDSCRRSLG